MQLLLRNRKFFFLTPVLVLTLVFCLSYGFNSAHAAFASFNLLPNDEPLTELYFAGNLPAVAQGGIISFSFSIHNLEGRNMDYPYLAYAEDSNGHAIIMKHSRVSVPDGQVATIKEIYRIDALPPGAVIFISLPSLRQTIHFSLSTNG